MMKSLTLFSLITFFSLVACQPSGSPSFSEPTSTEVTSFAYWQSTLQDTVEANVIFEETTITSQLSSAGVLVVVTITNSENIIVGYAYEARVSGFVDQIQFRVAIVDGLFTRFVAISHNEHISIGGRVINGLTQNLRGTLPNRDAVVRVLSEASAGRSGRSGTFDPLIRALEAIGLHYPI
jgi:hypothetical protein